MQEEHETVASIGIKIRLFLEMKEYSFDTIQTWGQWIENKFVYSQVSTVLRYVHVVFQFFILCGVCGKELTGSKYRA